MIYSVNTLFIVGSQGIPAEYGGFETFAEKLSTGLASRGHSVCVTCERTPSEEEGPPTYDGVDLLYVTAPDNHLRTIIADVKALWRCFQHSQPGDVVYLLGYGVGPFGWPAIKALQAKGVRVWLNPDGLEWKRSRWNAAAKAYLRAAEWVMLRLVDRVVCDAEAIEEHHIGGGSIIGGGVDPDDTTVVEYGAPVVDEDDLSTDAKQDRAAFLDRHGLRPGDYYLYVGRLVPENNLDPMVQGMLDDRIDHDLLVISERDESDPFYRKLVRTADRADAANRIVFAGTVYDDPLLNALRRGARGYLHGHEVGGTNPALIEAMGTASLVLALDTPFSREVLGDAGLFFGKSVESFVQTVRQAEELSSKATKRYRRRAQNRVASYYNWEHIVDEYETLVMQGQEAGQAATAST